MFVSRVRYRTQIPLDRMKGADGRSLFVALAVYPSKIGRRFRRVRRRIDDRDLVFMIVISDRDNRMIEMRVLAFTTENGATEGCSARVRPIAIGLPPTTNGSVLLLSVLMLTGCTLLDLGDIELPICDPEECGKNNEEAGITDAECMHYRCPKTNSGEVFGLCDLRKRDDDNDGFYNEACEGQVDGSTDCDDNDEFINPDAKEKCDGKDNDCDSVIDEGMVSQIEAQKQSIDLIERYPNNGGCEKEEYFELRVASGQPSTLLGIVQKDKGWLVNPDSANDKIPRLNYFYEGDPTKTNDSTCPSACGSETGCNFRQLAFDIVDTKEIVTASVTDFKCQPGQLRIGFANQKESLIHLEGGLSNDSGVAFGVEATCTEKQTVTCNPSGVHHPVIATIRNDDQQQALVAWMQESVEVPPPADCGLSTATASLRALGFWISYPRRVDPPWLFATQGGTPIQLNQTSNYGAPSLITWQLDDSNSGFLLAYSNALRDLEFTIFPALPNTTLKNDKNLPEWHDCPIVGLGDPIEHIVVALGAPPEPNSKHLSLLAAYRTGCGQESKIRLALFEFDTRDYTRCSAFNLNFSADLSVSRNGETIVDGPVVAYSDSDFYLPSGSNENESIGGWTVAWTERRSEGYFLLASRVSELRNEDRIVLLDDQPTELAQSEGEITSPVVFSDQNGKVYFGAIDHCEGRPIWGRTYCSKE